MGMEGSVKLLTVQELFNMKFCIPSYQRGYRWRKSHVEILLKDLKLFIDEKLKDSKEKFYSLQPLVVVKKTEENGQKEYQVDISNAETYADAEAILHNAWLRSRTWDVIDGQQRLTTLFLILKYLKPSFPELYTISYETRAQSTDFLKNIGEKTEKDLLENIDFARMGEVYEAIKKWFQGNSDYESAFLGCICKNVRFIWYESQGERPIEVFTRLNIGNIKLTDAELIKALILNRDMFSERGEQLEFVRRKIASEWDEIERRLQDDAFWYYLKPPTDSPTRIDFILDLALKVKGQEPDSGLFSVYESYFRESQDKIKARENIWESVLNIYRVLEDWFDNSELYHYTGYLMSVEKCRVIDLVKKWNGKEKSGRKEFIDDYLKNKIRESLNDIAKSGGKNKYESCNDAKVFLEGLLDIRYKDARDKDLDVSQGESGKRPDKTVCRPILLLHNILTVLKIGKGEANNSKYKGQKSFYKFPFNLYNNENWDVEHIASQTDNGLDRVSDQKEWLLSAWPHITDTALRNEIKSFCKKNDSKNFIELAEKCETLVVGKDKKNAIDLDDDKNMIWNFVLLDAGTNRGYKNALFPVKRRTIMFKERGVKLKNPKFDENEEVVFDEVDAKSPFVPLCTKNVFLQYYTKQGASPLFWSKDDAKSYKENILGLLKEFVFSSIEKKSEDVSDGNGN